MSSDQTTSPEPIRRGKRPIWVPNEFSTVCTGCQTAFTTLRRRHHCRSCGFLFCQLCSTKAIMLPPSFEYDSPQRVCDSCFSTHANEQQTRTKLAEENMMCVHFYLRGEPAFEVETQLPDIGGRPGKNSYFVKDKENNRKMLTILPAPHLHTIFSNDAKRPILFSTLMSIHHPFIHPISYLGYMKDKQKLIVVREPLFKGSLRDKIYRVDPFKKPFDEKYSSVGQPLSEKEIQKYGRQILEAILFLQKIKYPFPHLSTGNILFDKNGNCSITDLENSITGIPACYQPYFKSKDLTKEQFFQLEMVCFGHILWEMALGYPKGATPLAEVQDECPQKIYGLLETIFPRDSGALSTAQELLSSKFFSGETTSFTEVQFDKKSKAVLKQARDLLRTSLGVKVDKISRTPSSDTLPPEQPVKITKSPSYDSKSQVVPTKTAPVIPPAKKTASQPAPPPPPPSSAPPPPPPPSMNLPAATNERSSLLSSIRDPGNMKRLKKVKK